MPLITKILIFVLISLAAFGLGAWVGHQVALKDRATTDTKIKETTNRRTVTVKEPGGRETTTIDEHIVNNETSKSSVVAVKRPILNISGLGGVELKSKPELVYGLSVSREVIGPINVGVFGLSNGILGISVGINF